MATYNADIHFPAVVRVSEPLNVLLPLLGIYRYHRVRAHARARARARDRTRNTLAGSLA